ncbi:hypothetical protein ACOSP7_012548 [Xanthoceras sorbifolium]
MRFVLAFLLITLLFFSESLPSCSSAHHEAALTGTPLERRGLIGHDLNLKESSSSHGDLLQQPKKKLRVYMKKRASGSGGIATRARGKTSSAPVSVHRQTSSFHFGSVFIACSLLLAGFFNL